MTTFAGVRQLLSVPIMNQAGKLLFLCLFLIFCGMVLHAATQSPENVTGTETGHEAASFDAGKYVVEHVSDAHEWHIVTFGKTHVSIPLPILLYSKTSGLHLFLSSRFQHGHSAYKGFAIATEGQEEGKIVEVNDAGEIIGKPFDLSITKTVAGALISAVILVLILLAVARSAVKSRGKAPSGLQNLIEPVILFVRDEIAIPAIGKKNHERFLPILLSLFFIILINNLFGLIPVFPLGANVTGNISVTLVLALITFFITTFSGNKHYWKEIFNPDVPWWMKFPVPLMPFVEFFGMFTKPFVLMVRLFANMMAGHLIITVFVSLIFIFGNLFGSAGGLLISPVSVLFSVFIMILDILVSFIQAYVFTLLSALYFGMATVEHH
ncbi:MAG: ATP synthase subunit a [Bacteroidetes bacterium ADurb.Bin123]|nr:MAG: ATP synthase subunit a [Bacteroidetes bacterium ADurb.Bin123]